MNELRYFLEAYQERLGQTRSTETVAADRHELMKLFTWLSLSGRPLDAQALCREDVEAYLLEYAGWGITVGTYRKALRAFRDFFEFLLERGEITENPARRIARDVHRGKRPFGMYTPDEIDRLCAALPGAGFAAARDRAILLLLATVPLTRNELIDLNTADVDLGKGILRVRDRHSGRTRRVALSPMAADALERYIPEWKTMHPREEALFCLDISRYRAPEGKRRLTRTSMANSMHRLREKAGVTLPGRGKSFWDSRDERKEGVWNE